MERSIKISYHLCFTFPVFLNSVIARVSAILLLLLLSSSVSEGQSGTSIYHLKGATFQGSSLNPTFVSEDKWVVGVPLLSGFSTNTMSSISYQDLVSGENGFLNENDLMNHLGDRNYVSSRFDASLFYLGWRPIDQLALSIFARQRFQMDVNVDRDLASLGLAGANNLDHISVHSPETILNAQYYREYGIGLVLSSRDKKFDFGIRAKFLHGIASVKADENMRLSANLKNIEEIKDVIDSEEYLEVYEEFNDYIQYAEVSNATIYTSGQDEVKSASGQLFPDGNKGFGIDLGMNWKVDDHLSVALAVNDIGFIQWRDHIENYELEDVSLEISNLEDFINGEEDLTTLLDSLQQAFEPDTTAVSYRTALNSNIIGSVSYQFTPVDEVTLIVGHYPQRRRMNTVYSMGYTRRFRKILSLSTSLTHIPNEHVDVGLGMAFDFKGFQVYAATDNVRELSRIRKSHLWDVSMGMVFVFGRAKRAHLMKPEDKIYSKIKRKKQAKTYKYGH